MVASGGDPSRVDPSGWPPTSPPNQRGPGFARHLGELLADKEEGHQLAQPGGSSPLTEGHYLNWEEAGRRLGYLLASSDLKLSRVALVVSRLKTPVPCGPSALLYCSPLSSPILQLLQVTRRVSIA